MHAVIVSIIQCLYCLFFYSNGVVPGDGGSSLQAMLNRSSVLHRICPSKTDGWSHIWADFDMLIPALVECWVDNLKYVVWVFHLKHFRSSLAVDYVHMY